jgi:hypothetical protein
MLGNLLGPISDTGLERSDSVSLTHRQARVVPETLSYMTHFIFGDMGLTRGASSFSSKYGLSME